MLNQLFRAKYVNSDHLWQVTLLDKSTQHMWFTGWYRVQEINTVMANYEYHVTKTAFQISLKHIKYY